MGEKDVYVKDLGNATPRASAKTNTAPDDLPAGW